jgi:hypothetical protein
VVGWLVGSPFMLKKVTRKAPTQRQLLIEYFYELLDVMLILFTLYNLLCALPPTACLVGK